MAWAISNCPRSWLTPDVDSSAEEPDLTYVGWRAACSSSSKIHKSDPDAAPPPPPDAVAEKSFIVDMRSEMDPCQRPELVRLHGVLTGKKPVDQPLSALFSISKTALHGDVLGVPPERVTNVTSSVPWSEKTHSRLLWRGANTGMHYGADREWRDTHRVRLMHLGAEGSGSKTILPPPGSMGGKKLQDAAGKVDKSAANPHYFDMAFVGKAIREYYYLELQHFLAPQLPPLLVLF